MTDHSIEVPLDLPNIVHRRKASDLERPVCIAHIAKDFVLSLATKYPNRMFVGASLALKQNTLEISKFAVYENREHLGVVGAEYDFSRSAKGGVRYTVSDERITQARERGDMAYTRDLNKAIKLVSKSFRTKTHSELFSEASGKVLAMLRVKSRDSAVEFERCRSTVMTALMPHVLNNFDHFAPIALQHGAPATDVETLPSKHATLKVVSGMCRLLNSHGGILILIRGNDYVAEIGNGSEGEATTVIWTTDTLPAHVKKSIGMLKLVDSGYIIEGVGAKINNESFFVMPEVKHG